MIDVIDSDNLVVARLTRKHCSYFNDLYIKDLRMLGRDLKNVILLDNSPVAYKFQPQNGIHIKDYFFDKHDRELQKMLPFLFYLNNVRILKMNQKFFSWTM